MESVAPVAKLYYDPKTGLSSAKKLYQRAKSMRFHVSRAEVEKFVQKQESDQIYKKRRVKHHFPLLSYRPWSRVQIDLVDVSQLAHWNGGVTFLFCCIDVFTRYAWVLPLKSKGESEVLNAWKSIVSEIKEKQGFAPVQVDSDMESSFLSRAFKQFCGDNNISQNLLALDDYKGTAMVERFIHTVRELINRYMSAHGTKKYVDVLPDLVVNYNTRVHDGIKTSPQQAVLDSRFRNQYWHLARQKIEKAKRAAQRGGYSDRKLGDKVRLLIRKKVFDKGTAQKWTSSIHTITGFENGQWQVTDRVGTYKDYELQAVDEVQHHPEKGVVDEDEVKAVQAGRRMTRAMRKEGVEAASAEEVVVPVVERVRRERRPRDFGPVLVG